MQQPKNVTLFAQPSRRQFAGTVLAAAAMSFLPATVEAQEARPDGLSAADWDEVQARYANLLRVYGERLSASEKQHAKRILITNQHMLASIRSFAVENSDTAASTLRVVDAQ
jgi:hypothetical protein